MHTEYQKVLKPKEMHAQGGAVPLPEAHDVPHSRVELMLSARNLTDKDILSKSDPMCVVYMLMPRGDQEQMYVEIGRTEVIYNNLNPQWDTKIQMNYFFESKQLLRFEIYDIDNNNSKNLTSQDFLGRCECHLADIVTAVNGALSLELTGEPKIKGQLILRADEVNEGQKELVYMRCHGKKVASRGCFCCIMKDPFLEFHRICSNGTQQLVHRTEVQKNTIDPHWNSIEISVRHLCEGDKDRDFLVRCYNYKVGGRHKLLGAIYLNVNKLLSKDEKIFPLFKENKSKGAVITGGSIYFSNTELRREYTWLDFVKAGMQLEFTVSIDFTSSNGKVELPNSRHFIDPYCLNQYELAIKAVLEICEHYNTTKNFEAFGFGAKIPPSQDVYHFFPLNVDKWESTTTGVKGVMEAYRAALNRVELYGPTNFEETILKVVDKCKDFPRDGSRYQILLLITDGLITDMERTKLQIIGASDLPLSIIIIGVGDEDFLKMDELDSDESLLSHGKLVAKRDIVQFVPFRNYYGAIKADNNKLTQQQQTQMQAELAKAVLEEIPYQVTSYCKMHKIQPIKR